MEQGSNPSENIVVRQGSRVVTDDGAELGVVAEVQGDLFRVDAPKARDFWLDKRTARSATDEETCLAYDEQQLEAFKLAEPDEGAASPIASEQLETFESVDEQKKRRDDAQRGHA